MKIHVHRFEFKETHTIGKLYINDRYVCYTLEDTVRTPGIKIPSITSIPSGIYKVVIDFSNRFKKKMLHILNVPMFEGIRIHSGNKSDDTEGCIIVGMSWNGGDWVGSSKEALGQVYASCSRALESGEEVTLEIVNA
jgi:hypothetical protein